MPSSICSTTVACILYVITQSFIIIVLLRACQVEYERVKEAYVNMTHSLEASAAEKRALEVRLGQAAADASRDGRERRCAHPDQPWHCNQQQKLLEQPTTGVSVAKPQPGVYPLA